MLRFLLAVIWIAMITPSAFAWGKYGHVTICEIAYRTISDPARQELNRLMSFHEDDTRFNRACLFADRFPRQRPAEHFVNYPRDMDEITNANCGPANKCLMSAIADDAAILADTSVPNADRARALVLLGHWVGDIHQPLHVSYGDDRGGNRIKKRGRCSASNLHAVWDNCLIEHGVFKMNRIERLLGWGRFTKAYRAADRLIADISPEDVASWTDAEIWEWANESYNIVRQPSVGYCEMNNGACWYESDREIYVEGEEERTIQMTQDYIDLHTPIADEQLQKAGIRLAMIIDAALDP